MNATAEGKIAAGPKGIWSAYAPWMILALVLVFVIGVRLRLLDTPLERDEGEYAYAGQLLLQGIPPYREAFNMKFPGVYGAYAAIMALFGQTAAGIHLGFLIVNALTIVLVFLLARRLFRSGSAAAASAAIYGLLSLTPGIFGTQAHATHFVVFPMVAACLLLLRGRPAEIFAAGVLFGVAILMKQHGVFFAAFAATYLIWIRRPKTVPLLVAGVALPLLAIGFALWRAGVWDQFVFWTFTYARQYVSEMPLVIGFFSLLIALSHIIGRGVLLWLWPLAGLVVLWRQRREGKEPGFVLGLLVFSFLAVCPGLYFREHYFVLMLPAISLLAGAGFLWAQRRIGSRAAMTVFTLIALISIGLRSNFFFMATPAEADRIMYGNNPFPEAVRVADYVRQNTPDGERIAVFGSEPEIYFYARRHSVTGYIYTYGMMEDQPFAEKMQQDMIHDIETAHPRYIVWANVPWSWGMHDNSNRHILYWWNGYRNDYARVSDKSWDGGLEIWKRVR
jgi:4-amino-4-deoxy-L-arabinose transferase-like glycosyltransferase